MEDLLEHRSIRAVGMLFGTIVGVGVFGLPAVFGRSGYFVGLLELLIMGVVMVILFLMFAEITVQTPGKHRFVAYMHRFLGPWGARVAAVSILASMFGALLAFLIIGGSFLSELTSLNPFFSTLVLAGVVSIPVYIGMTFVSRLEVIVIGVMLFLYGILIVVSLPSFSWAHLAPTSPQGFENLLAPYGVLLFALSGFGAIPEMHDILGRSFKRLPRILISGYLLIIGFYALFTFAILGATGALVSEDSIGGLALATHPAVGILGSVLGLVSVFSIFTILATELMETIRLDFRIKQTPAWILTIGIPLFLFVIGFREFIGILGFVGSVFSGFCGILVILAYRKIDRNKIKNIRFPTIVSLIVGLVFVFGILIEIF